MTVCQFLAGRIRSEEYYNDELDAEDKEELKQAWQERCKSQKELMDGVKRFDFLRGKHVFQGLTRGKIHIVIIFGRYACSSCLTYSVLLSS
jgi:hypothetical protein